MSKGVKGEKIELKKNIKTFVLTIVLCLPIIRLSLLKGTLVPVNPLF
jgi:hypothetical protein